MTVTYTGQVATCRWFGCFLKLLFRWRGSIYKLVWLDLTCFLILYYMLNISYKFMNADPKKVFEAIVRYCSHYTNLIPLSFVLGFYVSVVMKRWWDQYTSIPWPDPIAVFVSTNVHGQDERGRVMRRTIMRYVCLCLTMVLGNISPRVKKRFPTLDHLVEAGLLNENEKHIIVDLNEKFPRHSKHWLPIVWAASIVTRARKEGRIRDDFAVKTIIDELNKFRGQCGLLISFDTISVPLVYTQVVTLAVYSYFLTSIIGQQWIEGKKLTDGVYNIVDNYFPIFTCLEFFFYMGWLKVAEQLINPFGEDDDDFEVNWMVDRNLQVSYLIVDEMHHEHPELIKDQYWDEIFPSQLPYTVASVNNKEEVPQPSTANIEVKKRAAEVIPVAPSSAQVDELVGKSSSGVVYRFPERPDENDAGVGGEKDAEEGMEDNASGIHFTAKHRDRHMSGSSSVSLQSMAGTISRVNTVASALKRFLSRDGDKNATTPEAPPPTKSASSTSLAKADKPGGSMKITDQVIEEVDEQMTIQSQKPDHRPTVQGLFSPSPPIDMPNSGTRDYMRTVSDGLPFDHLQTLPPGGVDELLSASAPLTASVSKLPMDAFGAEKSASQENMPREELDYNVPVDEFEILKARREQERIEKQKEMIARTMSTAPPTQSENPLDTQLLLENLSALAKEQTGSSAPAPAEKPGTADSQL